MDSTLTLRRLSACTLAAAAALLVAPAATPAAVTCDYSSGGKLLTVALGADRDDARLSVVAGEIKIARVITPVTCTGPGGPPTVTNTGAISVTGSGKSQGVTIAGADDFVPGPDPQDGSDSSGGTKEIEIFVNLNDGLESTLEVGTGDDSGRLVFGTSGINANPVGESVRDADIFPNGVENLHGFGGDGHDELSARGGSGTGGPLTKGILFSGNEGTDQIEGGDGPDGLGGGPGNDTVFAGDGDDVLAPGAGDDVANGGTGNDTVIVTTAGQPAATDLAISAPQDTGAGSDTLVGFENATAEVSVGATLRGDDGPNVLTAGEGDDNLEGRGGADVLNAGEGGDTLHVRDGGPDTADCNAEFDSVTADAPGIDTLMDCESVIFPPPPAAGGGEGIGGSGSQGGGGAGAQEGAGPGQVSPAAFGEKTFVTLALPSKRIPARGPLAVRVSNANGFGVTGTLSGQARDRLGAKSFAVPANARRIVKLKLPKALRRQLARKGRLVLRLSARVRDPAGSARTVRKTVRPRSSRRR